MKIVAFVPAKGQSERVAAKNLRILDGEHLFKRKLRQALDCSILDEVCLDTDSDAAVLPWDAAQGDLAFTTDSFTVQPIEFPGGNIGSLAVHGTTNDLAVAGAVPRYLSLGVLLDEGLGLGGR